MDRGQPRQRQKDNPELVLAAARRRHENEPIKFLLTSTRARAEANGIKFDLKPKDISIPDVCPVLGIPLVRAINGTLTDNSPSLDKFIPQLGYVPGNVFVISSKANRMKSNASIADVEKLLMWMRTREGSAA